MKENVLKSDGEEVYTSVAMNKAEVLFSQR